MNINATIFGQFLSFILFVYFCMKFIWPPVMKVIKKRQKKVYKSILSVQKAKKKLLLVNKKISKKIIYLKNKSIEILKKENYKKNLIIKESIKQALFEKNKIINRTTAELLIKYQKEKKKLKKFSVFLAIQISEKILCEKLSKNYINKIINEFNLNFKGF
ncbi:MAG: F0F1 ATP synthase subunit B [Buchnera aphidicola (Periphyllus acericola)]|uniref:F0F1 ATP synthase subunit B n=1 Tax=Buchnera aphidicola TaxID=9 RepID=UPI0030CE8B03|nr:F0F1 ATP synthase subunit B [Buchnera aphidicola (Periphyllus acericola)]